MIFSLVYWALRRVLELVLLGLRPERSKELEIVLLRHELQVLRLWGAKTRSGFGTRRSSALPRSIVVCSAGDPWTARKRWFRAASRGSDTRRQRPRSNKGTPHAWKGTEGIAVNATSIYWTNSTSAIGRATISGGSIEPEWITGASEACGIAVSPTYVYWTDHTGNSVGRAKLAGTEATQVYLSGASGPGQLVVNAEYAY